jgi:hypothetical protein
MGPSPSSNRRREGGGFQALSLPPSGWRVQAGGDHETNLPNRLTGLTAPRMLLLFHCRSQALSLGSRSELGVVSLWWMPTSCGALHGPRAPPPLHWTATMRAGASWLSGTKYAALRFQRQESSSSASDQPCVDSIEEGCQCLCLSPIVKRKLSLCNAIKNHALQLLGRETF